MLSSLNRFLPVVVLAPLAPRSICLRAVRLSLCCLEMRGSMRICNTSSDVSMTDQRSNRCRRLAAIFGISKFPEVSSCSCYCDCWWRRCFSCCSVYSVLVPKRDRDYPHQRLADEAQGHDVRAGCESHRGVLSPGPVGVVLRLRKIPFGIVTW